MRVKAGIRLPGDGSDLRGGVPHEAHHSVGSPITDLALMRAVPSGSASGTSAEWISELRGGLPAGVTVEIVGGETKLLV